MSIAARNAKSIRKKDVKESKALANGFTKLVFAHKATAGETGINLGSLVVPPEMSALGFTNPSSSRLLDARIFQFKDNIELQSSSKNTLMQSLSYRVASNSRLNFEGFTAEEGEIFIGVIDSNPISGIQVIDAKQGVALGDLAVDATDFAIGFSTSTFNDEIVVFKNGLEQRRNTNNSSSVLDGNYFVVPATTGSGFGSVVRFNVSPTVSDDYIKVAALGGVVESPTNSTWDELEKVQGQIDAMIPDLAQATGNPETDYQAAPNNVDLKAFGDRVLTNENDIAALQGNINVPYLIAHSHQTGASVASVWTNLIYSVETYDPFAAYDNTTGIFLVQKKGIYNLNAHYQVSGTFVTDTDLVIGIWVNNVNLRLDESRVNGATGNGVVRPSIGANLILDVGDVLEFRYFTATSETLTAGQTAGWADVTLIKELP